MADAGVDQYTFHIEPVKDVIPLCRKIREAGMKVGLALKPGTGIEAVRQYISHADMILIMTVEPGFGGQKFMHNMMPKVQWLRQNYPFLDIEVDGGVGLNTINACAEVSIKNICRLWAQRENGGSVLFSALIGNAGADFKFVRELWA